MITKKELLDRLEAKGIKIGGNPDRMLTRFISLGLIDKPVRFGLGQGKGSVSKFDDKDAERIKKIVLLKKEGHTYEQIKQKLMSFDDWLSFIKSIKASSETEEEAVNIIKKIPSLSDSERGRLKLTVDVTEHLTEIVVDELLHFFYDRSDEASRKSLVQDVYNSIEFCLNNVFHDFGLDDEDHEKYLAGEKRWRFPTSTEGLVRGMLKEASKKKPKPAKGGKKHGR